MQEKSPIISLGKAMMERDNELHSFVRRVRIILILIPGLLVLPVLWFTSIEMQQSAAKIQFVVEASKAGLLNAPKIRDLATAMLGGNFAYTVFLACLAVVIFICYFGRRMSRNLEYPWMTQGKQAEPQPQSLPDRDYSIDVAASVTPYFPPANESWQNQAYPLQLMTIQAQGTRQASREMLIEMLEKGLARLKSGEIDGEESDDDFGFRFVMKPEMDLSIFGEESSSR
jgi:hypothetical protein